MARRALVGIHGNFLRHGSRECDHGRGRVVLEQDHAYRGHATRNAARHFRAPVNPTNNTSRLNECVTILWEVITLSVFVPFALLYMRAPLKLDYLWAALCMLGAVYSFFGPNE